MKADLLKKLKALADRGEGGEKINADAMLKQLAKKYNISLDELEEETENDYYFNLTDHDTRLFMQVVASVNREIKRYGEFAKKIMKQYNLKGNYMITCTASEIVEITAKYEFYKSLYKEEEQVFYRAFCIKNDLLVEPKDKDKKISEQESEKWIRAIEMSESIEGKTFHKQLKN